MECIFCAVVAGQAQAWSVYEDDDCVAFLDVNPITAGHTLVVPRRHALDLLALTESEAQSVMLAAHRVARLLEARLAPDGLNLVQATREAAWQTVFHMHLHVIPRYEDDGLRAPWQASPADPDGLTALRERLLGVA